MFSFFKSDPVKKLKKKAAIKYEEAMKIQRSGDLRLYAQKMKELEDLENEIAALKQS